MAAIVLGANPLVSNEIGALSLSFETIDYGVEPSTNVANDQSPSGSTPVFWTRGTRLQALFYATFQRGNLEFYGGPGLSYNKITDGAPLQSIASTISSQELAGAQEAFDAADPKLSAVFGAGMQWKRNRLAVFGEYRLVPAGQSFLKEGTQMTWTTGSGILSPRPGWVRRLGTTRNPTR